MGRNNDEEKLRRLLNKLWKLDQTQRLWVVLKMYDHTDEAITDILSHVWGLDDWYDLDDQQIKYILKSLEKGFKQEGL